MSEDNINKVEVHVYNGGQVNVANDNGKIHTSLKNNENYKIKQKVKSRTQEYVDKWNKNMFLNDFNKRDENAGINVKLSEVYLESHLPHYLWKKNSKPVDDLKELLQEYINGDIDNKMLLILGQPGIGKSTLITWVTANFSTSLDNIFVYQFASDLNHIDWQNKSKDYDITDEILNAVNLSYDDLEGKTLIIDGFDEINVGNSRAEILNKLFWKLKKGGAFYNFSLIITCRENYIQDLYRIECDYITLQTWNETQIESFCDIYQEKTNGKITQNTLDSIIKNREILGIPLVLYMILALNIEIRKEGSIVDIYDQIFSLEGGIYDRCIKNIRYADFHRISEIKKQIHLISKRIAVWMFENRAGEASIPKDEYEQICNCVIQEQGLEDYEIKQDFLIGTFFKLTRYCEGVGTEKLYFVHRSIYEYFVAETIYNLIEKVTLGVSGSKNKEVLAGNIAVYLKKGQISYTIGEYLEYKVMKLYNRLSGEIQKRFYQWWEIQVGKMMDVGMFYYVEGNIGSCKNIIAREIQCFVNLMEILRLISKNKSKYIMKDISEIQFERYIKICCIEYETDEEFKGKYLNLNNTYLYRINLSRMNLKYANLSNAILVDANLEDANLEGVDFNNTIFKNTNFKNANLKDAKLININLEGTSLEGTNLEGSVWVKDNLLKLLPHIKNSNFTYISIQEEDVNNPISREKLFADSQ